MKNQPTVIPLWKVLINLPKYYDNPTPIMIKSLNENNGIYQSYVGFQRVFVTDRTEVIRHVLQKNHRNYRKSSIMEILAEEIGYGLLTSNGDYWLKQRRLIQPSFHRQKLVNLVDIMIEETNTYLDKLEERITTQSKVEMSDEMMHLTLLVVMRSLFGQGISEVELRRVDKIVSETQQYIIAKIRRPLAKWIYKLTGKEKYYKSLPKELDDIIYNIIKERRTSDERHDDIFDMLLNAKYKDSGEGMTDQQLRDESLILFLAGHETSANALTWLWYLLTQHPEVETKLLAEIEEILGDRDITFEDLPRLKYTKQVIQEAMRLYPPAWVIDRAANEADDINGIQIPKDSMVIFPIYAVHRNEKYWENAATFNPDRFEKAPAQSEYIYFPFGGGPRLCIGNNFAYFEMQIIVAHFIRRFKINLVPNQQIDIHPLITLRPKNGIYLKVEKRG